MRNKDSEGGFDPCTAADLRAQATIFNHLLAVWPDLEVVGEEESEEVIKEIGTEAVMHSVADVERRMGEEENGHNASKDRNVSCSVFDAVKGNMRDLELSRVRVFVDPLDGTTEFTKGRLEAVTSLIGISYDGIAIAGIIHQPFADSSHSLPVHLLSSNVSDEEERRARDTLTSTATAGHSVVAVVGSGVFGLEGVPVLHRRRADTENLIVTTTRSHASPAVLRYLSRLDAHHIERVGGSGYKALRVACGLADVFTLPNPHTSLWDTCAPEALMASMGGKLTDCNGKQIDYARPLLSPQDAKNTAGILAAVDSLSHARVLEQLDFSRSVGVEDP